MFYFEPLTRLQTALTLSSSPGPATAPVAAALRHLILEDADILCACESKPGGYTMTPFYLPDGRTLLAVYTDLDRAHAAEATCHPIPLLDVLDLTAVNEELDGLIIDPCTADFVLDRKTACDTADAALLQLQNEWDDYD